MKLPPPPPSGSFSFSSNNNKNNNNNDDDDDSTITTKESLTTTTTNTNNNYTKKRVVPPIIVPSLQLRLQILGISTNRGYSMFKRQMEKRKEIMEGKEVNDCSSSSYTPRATGYFCLTSKTIMRTPNHKDDNDNDNDHDNDDNNNNNNTNGICDSNKKKQNTAAGTVDRKTKVGKKRIYSSIYKGVSMGKKKKGKSNKQWRTQVSNQRVLNKIRGNTPISSSTTTNKTRRSSSYFVGCFDSQIEAAHAYDDILRKYYDGPIDIENSQNHILNFPTTHIQNNNQNQKQPPPSSALLSTPPTHTPTPTPTPLLRNEDCSNNNNRNNNNKECSGEDDR